MNITNSINNNQINFQQRLYLKHINEKDVEFLKGIAKDFHGLTKDIKGASFSLCDKGDTFMLVSNYNKINSSVVSKSEFGELGEKVKNAFLNRIVRDARFIRTIEDADLSTASAPLKDQKKVIFSANDSQIKNLKEMIKSKCNNSSKK